MSVTFSTKTACGTITAFFLFVSLWANPVDEDNRLRLMSNDGAFYAWLKSGLLFYGTSDHGEKGKYLYCGSDGYLVEISTPLGFSQMLQEQLKGVQDSTNFIQNRAPYVAVAFLGPRSSVVLNEGFVKYKKDLPQAVWINASASDIKRSLTLLEKYGHIATSVGGSKWKSEFYLLLSDGSIEQWELDGEVYPFSLDQLKITVVEQKGSVSPVREYM